MSLDVGIFYAVKAIYENPAFTLTVIELAEWGKMYLLFLVAYRNLRICKLNTKSFSRFSAVYVKSSVYAESTFPNQLYFDCCFKASIPKRF